MRRTAIFILVLAIPACGGGSGTGAGGSGTTTSASSSSSTSSSSTSSSSSSSSSSGAPSPGMCSGKLTGDITGDLTICAYAKLGPPGWGAEEDLFFEFQTSPGVGVSVSSGGILGVEPDFKANTTYGLSDLQPTNPLGQPADSGLWQLQWVDNGKGFGPMCHMFPAMMNGPLCTGVALHTTTIDAAGRPHGTMDVTLPAGAGPNPVTVTIHIDM